VEKKVAGEEIEVIEAPEPTKVLDLMEALKQSVESTKKKEKRPAKRAPARKKAAAS
jgi:DNA end-binding protein Ku